MQAQQSRLHVQRAEALAAVSIRLRESGLSHSPHFSAENEMTKILVLKFRGRLEKVDAINHSF